MPESTASLLRTPQYFDQYVPQPTDFKTMDEYLAALKAGAEDTSDPIGLYYDPIADVMRGGAQTEREFATGKLNRFLDDINGPGPGVGLRMQSFMKNHPEMAETGYLAYDENGRSVVDPIVQGLMEKYGFVPTTPVPGAPGEGDGWNQNRLGFFNRNFLGNLDKRGGSATVEDPWVANAIDRLMTNTGSTYEEALAHIDAFLNDNGYDLLPNGNIGTMLPMNPTPIGGAPGDGLTPSPQPGGQQQGGGLPASPQQGGQSTMTNDIFMNPNPQRNQHSDAALNNQIGGSPFPPDVMSRIRAQYGKRQQMGGGMMPPGGGYGY